MHYLHGFHRVAIIKTYYPLLYVTAIARDYMDGALIFELDGHNGGDEAMDNQVAGVFSDMINSLEFAN
ncbi:hypothetical protein [Pseudobutyrivibrio ruminis]|uniref:hypothetical protein n=1 Tax=Pseudobutyrivibrio ruminis TaxID=46206 RepID=UPI0012DFBF03|nr:hypothetical protein [Pseudobutyrivibrio ruminis]